MERNEKLEKITVLTQELGVSFDEVVAYWQAQGKLFLRRSPKETVKAQQYQTPKKITPGMFVYADGLIYPEIIKGRQIKAIVGSVKGFEVLAVCLQETRLPWSNIWLEAITTSKKIGGQEATRKILKIYHGKEQMATAAQWCYDYDRDGVQKGEAFLPSLTELEELFANRDAINVSLKVLGVALLESWYWSSTEYNNNCAWRLGMSYGFRYNCGKDDSGGYVRPVISIEL